MPLFRWLAKPSSVRQIIRTAAQFAACTLAQLFIFPIKRAECAAWAKHVPARIHCVPRSPQRLLRDRLIRLLGNDLRRQHGSDRIIHIILMQDTGRKRDAQLLEAAVYRDSAAASANHKHCRRPLGSLQFSKTECLIIGAGSDAV